MLLYTRADCFEMKNIMFTPNPFYYCHIKLHCEDGNKVLVEHFFATNCYFIFISQPLLDEQDPDFLKWEDLEYSMGSDSQIDVEKSLEDAGNQSEVLTRLCRLYI